MFRSKRSLKRSVWGFTIGAAVIAFIGAILLIISFTQFQAQFTLQLVGGLLLGLGSIFIFVWCFTGFRMQQHQEIRLERILSPMNIITQFSYTPNEDFRTYMRSEFGWGGYTAKMTTALCSFFFITGLSFSRNVIDNADPY